MGFAWGHEVPTVFVCQEPTQLEFDIQGQRCIHYGSIRDLEKKLGTELGEPSYLGSKTPLCSNSVKHWSRT